ncbi:hypothetical protein [Megamonas hypermegale]|uniref:hypothetical protein n=1 Tax=Megamonas hypermegale TaxID=158847 RepID=UPI0026F0EA87|nr:hypothetical protein [Megamonas hypermegale]
MLKKKIKRGISIITFAFFLSTSISFSFIDTAAAAPPPPKQGQIKPPPPRRAVTRPAARQARPNIKPAPRPRVSRPASRPNRTVKPMPRPARPNIKPRPAARPGSAVKPIPRPRPGSIKPPARPARPAIKPGSSIRPSRPNITRPRPGSNIKPSKPGAIRPPRKPGENMRPPMPPRVNPDKHRPPQGDKRPILRPRPDGDKVKPPAVRPGFRPDRPRPDSDKFRPIKDKNPALRPHHDRPPIPPKHHKPPKKPHHKFKLHDRFVPPPPPIYHRAPRWLLFSGSFIYPYPTTVVNHVVMDYSYLNTVDGVYLDNFIKTKYIEGEYEGQDYYADYYIDKNSLEVVQYNPPDYIIRVNEVSFDNENMDSPYITTWEFKYNLDYRTVYFRNVYDSYQIEPKDWTFLNTYNDEYYLLPTAEMAFYLAYKYRFFDNQPDSFYDVATL